MKGFKEFINEGGSLKVAKKEMKQSAKRKEIYNKVTNKYKKDLDDMGVKYMADDISKIFRDKSEKELKDIWNNWSKLDKIKAKFKKGKIMKFKEYVKERKEIINEELTETEIKNIQKKFEDLNKEYRQALIDLNKKSKDLQSLGGSYLRGVLKPINTLKINLDAFIKHFGKLKSSY